MTTTDDTALTERIARALYENAEYYGPEDVQPAWEHRDDEERDEWREIAAAVLPIIRAEVKRAQAQAWEKGWEAAIDQAPGDVWFDEWHYQTNPYRTEQNDG